MTDLPRPLDTDFPYWDETGAYLCFLASEADPDLHSPGELASDALILAAELGRLAREGLHALRRLLWAGRPD